jgi:hypothetical protein
VYHSVTIAIAGSSYLPSEIRVGLTLIPRAQHRDRGRGARVSV